MIFEKQKPRCGYLRRGAFLLAATESAYLTLLPKLARSEICVSEPSGESRENESYEREYCDDIYWHSINPP